MPEKLKFDFSKEEDQKRFEKLPEEKRKEVVADAQEEARNEKIVSEETALTAEDKKAKEFLVWAFSANFIDAALKMKKEASLPDSVILSPEVQSAARERMIKTLSHIDRNIDTAQEIKDQFNLPEDIVQSAVREAMIKSVSAGDVPFAIRMKNSFNLPDSVLSLPEIQSAVGKVMAFKLSYNDIDEAMRIRDKFNLQEDFVQLAAKEGLVKNLSTGSISNALKIKETFNPPDSVITSSEVQLAVKKGLASILAYGKVEEAIEIKNKFKLPEDIFQLAAIEGLARSISVSGGSGENMVIEIKNKLNLPDSVLLSPEIQLAGGELIAHHLSSTILNHAIKIKKQLNLQGDIVQKAVKEAMIGHLRSGDVDSAVSVGTLVDKTSYKSIISAQEVQETAKKLFFDTLSHGSTEAALNIENQFWLEISLDEIFRHFPEFRDFLEEISKISPQLYDHAIKSQDILLELLAFKENSAVLLQELQEKPFLVDAVVRNPRFGIRMLFKFPELDELSKENIQTLFEAKKEICIANPDMSPESVEFHQLMQNKLKEYRNNPQILEAIERNGIGVKQWLNYDEESSFDLGKEEDIPLSEKLKTPVFRIRESLENYSSSLKNILAEHKNEFTGMVVTEDLEEIKLQIEKFTQEKEKAVAESNSKKAEGIDKGMAQLQKRISNPKTIPLWEKVLGDLSLVDRVTKDVLAAYTVLIESETSLENYSKDQSKSAKERREEVLKLKRKAENAKKEFVSKFKTLETRVGVFKERLGTTLTSAIGEERANNIIGDWETAIAEGMSHFASDKTTIDSIFDHEDEEQGKLDRTPMAIRVWTRNADVDLYLGNYTDCCIRIDSEHMGEESTIADYLTDVGIQVVTVYDEKKKIPVVAAWTFIGVNGKGEAALVIDNIEANTDYSTNYRTQLEAKLKIYFAEYTKAVGLKKFVQGQLNNDLVIAEMDGKYKKLGGYNREDGYFLEGEHDEDDDEEDDGEVEDEDDNN